ncbi:hypothetical protein [Orlajensenia leifsoniae]|uniref:Uncharacterized protein n=1 Tax=Orlajensenia leifsoniae TaxID=2561933 RepID=A0A4Y9QQH6_9MICO|nr:hypothetical protein [Leifsonia flava]TFV94871.1 hypothetical protein E4M00_17100 [Leifsonia flava]
MNRRAQLAVVHQVFDNELHFWWEWADDDGGTLVRWSAEDKAINSHLVEAADDLPVLWRWLDEVAMTFQTQTATQMGLEAHPADQDVSAPSARPTASRLNSEVQELPDNEQLPYIDEEIRDRVVCGTDLWHPGDAGMQLGY